MSVAALSGSGSPFARPAALDEAEAVAAAGAKAVALTNNSVALSWEAAPEPATYHLYSDMGSGFGVYIYKTRTTQPAFLDEMLRPGMGYSYRITRQANNRERVLARLYAETFAPQSGAGNLRSGPPSGQIPAATPVAAPTALPADAVLLGLLSDNNFTDNFDILTIVGEVRNDSPVAVGHTDITVTFYEAEGAIIGTARGQTLLDVIPPGKTSPFIISLTRPVGLSSYSLRAIGRPVDPPLDNQFAVVSVKRYEDETGFLHIKGVIKNTGSTVSRRTRAAAVLYGRDGRIINVGFAYTTPPTLSPGREASYEIIFTYYPRYLTQTVIPFEE